MTESSSYVKEVEEQCTELKSKSPVQSLGDVESDGRQVSGIFEIKV